MRGSEEASGESGRERVDSEDVEEGVEDVSIEGTGSILGGVA